VLGIHVRKKTKNIYIKYFTRYVRDGIDTAGRPRGEMISERERGIESEKVKEEGGSD
jgi:antirestriction protein ArdC